LQPTLIAQNLKQSFFSSSKTQKLDFANLKCYYLLFRVQNFELNLLRLEISAVECHFDQGELQDLKLALRNLHKTFGQKTKISANNSF
jgi:hypothetical protein